MNNLSLYAQRLKKWYDMGLWNYSMVEKAYKKGKITEEEFIEIVGENNKEI